MRVSCQNRYRTATAERSDSRGEMQSLLIPPEGREPSPSS